MSIEWMKTAPKADKPMRQWRDCSNTVRATTEFVKGEPYRLRISIGKRILERCNWGVADVITVGRTVEKPRELCFMRIQSWPYTRRSQANGFAICSTRKRELDGGLIKNANITLPFKLNLDQPGLVPQLWDADLEVVSYGTGNGDGGSLLVLKYSEKDSYSMRELVKKRKEKVNYNGREVSGIIYDERNQDNGAKL